MGGRGGTWNAEAKTQDADAKIPPIEERQKAQCARTVSSSASASKLKDCPPEASMVIGKVSTPTACAHNRALLSSCPAKPRRDNETAAAPYISFLQKQVQIYFRT